MDDYLYILCGAITVLALLAFRELRALWILAAVDGDAEVTALREHIVLLKSAKELLAAVADVVHDERVELSGHHADVKHVIELAKAYRIGCASGQERQRRLERETLTHTSGVLQAVAEIGDLKDSEVQRPLRVEAQEAKLRKLADGRVIEAMLSGQALSQLRQSGQEDSTERADPKAVIRASLLAAIESAKADAQDSSDLERALKELGPWETKP